MSQVAACAICEERCKLLFDCNLGVYAVSISSSVLTINHAHTVIHNHMQRQRQRERSTDATEVNGYAEVVPEPYTPLSLSAESNNFSRLEVNSSHLETRA